MLITFVCFVTMFSRTLQAGACHEAIAKVLSVQERVERLIMGRATWSPVVLNERICPGDRVRVGRNSRASLLLNDNTLLRLAENSSVLISAPKEDGGTKLDLIEGLAHFISRVRRNFQVNTPYINAGIEGTEFTVVAASKYAAVTVLEGRVRAANAYGEVILNGSQKAVALAHQAPRIEQVINPLDAVQWTLFYPPLTEFESVAGRHSMAAYRRGDIEEAFATLAQNADIKRDPDLLVYRASLHLWVGGVEAARHDLDQALTINPDQAEALALLSIIATVQNQRQSALELARRSIKADSHGLAPLLALSYAQQAMFLLPEALETARQATEAVPDSALAWSHLARLHLMFQQLEEATEAVQKAVAIAPSSSRPLTTLGFVQLASLDIGAARQSFEQAILFDRSAAPLPRFGLGLVEIRKGNLAEGRRQLEIAANLDPANAMIRSYLGKAYYEEKRNEQAETQFTLAKQFDQNDPTAWFYNAILQQSQNRPIAALKELKSAIERNDNRAVYRSRFLLDQDEAARDASQARVYQDLGFKQLARTEAYKSLQASAQNHSAHRFLADSYSGEPLLEKARMSELLQSQLLQPLNRNPIQPQLVTSGLGILDGAGPSASGYAEYTPLFTRNGLDLQFSAIGGDNNTSGDEVILSGLYDRVAFGLGQFYYDTDGWRENSDLKQDLYNAFLQVAPTSSTSVHFEYRWQNKESGDLALKFEPDRYYRSERNKLERRVSRIGLHHQLGSNGHILASAIDQKSLRSKSRDHEWYSSAAIEVQPIGTYPGFFNQSDSAEIDRDSLLFELQLIQPYHTHNFILGGGRFREKSTFDWSQSLHEILLITPEPTGIISIPVNINRQGMKEVSPECKKVYVYSYFALPDRINLTLGLAHEEIKSQYYEMDQTSPKIGLTWDAMDNITFRAAYLERLTWPDSMDQTIEPTQLAGFNQLLNLDDGDEIRLFGIGFDAVLSRSASIGADFTRNDIEIYWKTNGDSDFYESIDQKLSHVYIHWTPTDRLGVRIAYKKDDFSSTWNVKKIKTMRIPLGLSYHWNSGMFLQTEGTYIKQEITRATNNVDDDNFWNIDVVVGYRLPKRYGKFELIAKNLLGETFEYYDAGYHVDNLATPQYLPARQLFARFTLNF